MGKIGEFKFERKVVVLMCEREKTDNCVVCPNGREGDCMSLSTIYPIFSTICGEGYIGDTVRPLWIGVSEHLDKKVNSQTNMPSGGHRVEEHDDTNFDS
ncbi:hypothetical protein KIN20_017892 [Parelaphostrongylus tenuis]|uniref:Uncharacterized protein n=1 Tax=Parelaphostrongylus tenuis TaxID=148309 RepID=A0AAD5N2Z3_PARTN|nr:hypothetical protein KIN20_017892 [Parelaphostrongylus tenuis]